MVAIRLDSLVWTSASVNGAHFRERWSAATAPIPAPSVSARVEACV
jgi:hypothetical protein